MSERGKGQRLQGRGEEALSMARLDDDQLNIRPEVAAALRYHAGRANAAPSRRNARAAAQPRRAHDRGDGFSAGLFGAFGVALVLLLIICAVSGAVSRAGSASQRALTRRRACSPANRRALLFQNLIRSLKPHRRSKRRISKSILNKPCNLLRNPSPCRAALKPRQPRTPPPPGQKSRKSRSGRRSKGNRWSSRNPVNRSNGKGESSCQG